MRQGPRLVSPAQAKKLVEDRVRATADAQAATMLQMREGVDAQIPFFGDSTLRRAGANPSPVPFSGGSGDIISAYRSSSLTSLRHDSTRRHTQVLFRPTISSLAHIIASDLPHRASTSAAALPPGLGHQSAPEQNILCSRVQGGPRSTAGTPDADTMPLTNHNLSSSRAPSPAPAAVRNRTITPPSRKGSSPTLEDCTTVRQALTNWSHSSRRGSSTVIDTSNSPHAPWPAPLTRDSCAREYERTTTESSSGGWSPADHPFRQEHLQRFALGRNVGPVSDPATKVVDAHPSPHQTAHPHPRSSWNGPQYNIAAVSHTCHERYQASRAHGEPTYGVKYTYSPPLPEYQGHSHGAQIVHPAPHPPRDMAPNAPPHYVDVCACPGCAVDASTTTVSHREPPLSHLRGGPHHGYHHHAGVGTPRMHAYAAGAHGSTKSPGLAGFLPEAHYHQHHNRASTGQVGRHHLMYVFCFDLFCMRTRLSLD